jgi:hypothetical protein
MHHSINLINDLKPTYSRFVQAKPKENVFNGIFYPHSQTLIDLAEKSLTFVGRLIKSRFRYEIDTKFVAIPYNRNRPTNGCSKMKYQKILIGKINGNIEGSDKCKSADGFNFKFDILRKFSL